MKDNSELQPNTTRRIFNTIQIAENKLINYSTRRNQRTHSLISTTNATNLPTDRSTFLSKVSSPLKNTHLRQMKHPTNRKSSSIQLIIEQLKEEERQSSNKNYKTIEIVKSNKRSDSSIKSKVPNPPISPVRKSLRQFFNKHKMNLTSSLNSVSKLLKREKSSVDINSSHAMNNYLIRDFQIGSKGDAIEKSKIKTELVNKFFSEKQTKQQRRVVLQNKQFERMKNDKIYEDSSLMTRTHSAVSVSQCNEEDLRKTKRELWLKNLQNVKTNANKVADEILEIDEPEYEIISHEGLCKEVYKTNLYRIIKLRRIIKGKKDKLDECLDADDINTFKQSKLQSDTEVARVLKKFGPCKFLKDRFRVKTNDKLRNVNGKYFGVLC